MNWATREAYQTEQKSLHNTFSGKDLKGYSLCKALAAPAQSLTGIEKEAHQELYNKLDQERRAQVRGLLIPPQIFTITRSGYAYQVGTPELGGNLVEQTLHADRFVEKLRSRSLCLQMGAMIIPGLVGDALIPKSDSVTELSWVNEGEDLANKSFEVSQIKMSPKTVGGIGYFTRTLLLQSTPEIEGLIRNDFVKSMSTAIDKAIIAGTAAAKSPVGLLNRLDIPQITIDTDGSEVDLDLILGLEQAVAESDADVPTLTYLMSPAIRSRLKSILDFPAAACAKPLWQENPKYPSEKYWGLVNTYLAGSSSNVPSDLTKGSGTDLSAIIFGDFSQIMIGEWGVLEVLANPYGVGWPSGSVEVRIMQSLDINVRNTEAFSVAKGVF